MEAWGEWDGSGIDGAFVFMTPMWREDTTTERALLAHAIREVGVTMVPNSAHMMANSSEFVLSWYGYLDGALDPSVCDEEGYTAEGETVDTPRKCTFAVLEAQRTFV